MTQLQNCNLFFVWSTKGLAVKLVKSNNSYNGVMHGT